MLMLLLGAVAVAVAFAFAVAVGVADTFRIHIIFYNIQVMSSKSTEAFWHPHLNDDRHFIDIMCTHMARHTINSRVRVCLAYGNCVC
jgi:hypothetical protein